MRQRNQIANWVRRVASPETWALCALILFAVSLAGRAPEGPHMQLSYAACASTPEFQAGAPLEARFGELADKIDMRTEKVWRRLEMKMRLLEERLAKSPGACDQKRGLRASMFED